MTGRAFAACVAAALLAGCGAGGDGGGKAQVWITRDRGAHVIAVRTVPAGLTGMQALDRVADVKTRYGGRFVQSIEGLQGSLTGRRDWFYFVNGVEGDRSAAEVRLRDGDVEWWDLRSWTREMSVPVVVGAWPEPFLNGFGKRYPTIVGYWAPRDRPVAKRIARLVHATMVRPAFGAPPILGRHNDVEIANGGHVFRGERERGGTVHFIIDARDARRLLRNPKLARFRYEGLP